MTTDNFGASFQQQSNTQYLKAECRTMSGSTRRIKKRPLLLPLDPVACASRNQEILAGYKSSSANAHAKVLAELQLHLPNEVVYSDPRQRIYHLHVDLSGWHITDASLQHLYLHNDQDENVAKSTFHTLTVDGNARITARGLHLLFKAAEAGGKALRVLRLGQCQLLSFGGVLFLDGTTLPCSLTELDVSCCAWVDDNFLRTLAHHCSSLTHLTLKRCRRVTDYGVAAFSESYVVSLTFLDVSFCLKLTDIALLALLVGTSSSMVGPGGASVTTSSPLTRLRVLHAAGLSLVNGLTLVGLRSTSAARLEILNLSCCSGLGVAALKQLTSVRALSRLTKLDLSRCFLVNDQILSALGETCTHLAILLLAFCSNVTDYGIQRLVGDKVGVCADQQEIQVNFTAEDIAKNYRESGCRLLKTLDIAGCFLVSSHGILSLGERCPLLQSVTLDGVRRLDYSGVRALLNGCSKLHTIRWRGTLVRRRSDELSVTGACAAFFSIPHLCEASVTALVRSSIKILHIGTTQCDINALATALRGIRYFPSLVDTLTDLDVTSLATDALCESLGKCCTNLRTLCLSRSRYFSTTSFHAVLRGCSRLRSLDIKNCEQIGDETMIALSKAPCCPHLETLLIANDWQVTDIGVAMLLRPATSIVRLDVRHCPEVHKPVLQALAAARGHISEATRDGLTPRHPNVVAFLRRELRRQASARKINGWLRCMLDARVSTKSTLERAMAYFRRLKKAAVYVQRWYRCMSAQKLQRRVIAEARRLQFERCELHWTWIRALCVLSRCLRGFIRMFIDAREHAAIQNAKHLRMLRDHAATEIQRHSRGWLGRKRAFDKRRARDRRLAKAALVVQRVFRGYRSRKCTAQLRKESVATMRSAMLLHCTNFVAGQHIQRIIRGFFGRKTAKRRAVAVYERLRVNVDRSKQIQRAFRAYTARVAFHNMMFQGASALQKLYRGYCGRRRARIYVLTRAYASRPRILILIPHSVYTSELAIAWKRKRDAALVIASTLQMRYRGYCGRREARGVLARQRQRWCLEYASARTIQHFFRSIVILVRIAAFHALLCLRRCSATKIQATWRMWLAKVLALARRLRKNRFRQRTATLNTIGAEHQDRPLFLRRGAIHLIVWYYRASLSARGWQSPKSIGTLHRSATQIQALVRGHFGRIYAYWFRYELARAVSTVQRVWRGKQGKKMWRRLVEERQQLRQLQIKNDRAAWFAQTQIKKYALEAFEYETKHAVVLQLWIRTLKKRQILFQSRKRRDQEAYNRAKTKMVKVLSNLTGSVVCQARVWQDCMDRKAELVTIKEEECVALEKEIENLKRACIEAYAGSTRASQELIELSKRKREVEHSKTRIKRATEEINQHIQLFAMRAKQLTIENVHALNANRQLQLDLQRMGSKLQSFNANLRGRLPLEPLLLSHDVDFLLSELSGEGAQDNESCDL